MEMLMISYWDFQDHGIQVTKRTPLYFAQQGHNVTFMVHSEMTLKPSKIDNLHQNAKVLRFEMPFKWFDRIPKLNRIRQLILFGLFCFFHTRMLYRDGKKPSIIYSAECDAILIGTVLSRILKIPLITRYYGVSNLLIEHPFKHFLYSLCLRCPADMAILTNDGTNALKILQKVNKNIGKLYFWSNGIDKINLQLKNSQCFRKLFQIPEDRVILLTVGRLYGWKRVDRAIKAVAILIQKKICVNLLVVGHGPEKSRLKKLATELGVDSSVFFVGAVKHEEMSNIYSIGDILLSFHEMANLGNPVWEAMNAGLCIVTLNDGKTNEIITDGITGKLIDIDFDEERLIVQISNELEELVTCPEYRHRLATGAKIYGENNLWTWNDRLKTELESINMLLRDKVAHKDQKYS